MVAAFLCLNVLSFSIVGALSNIQMVQLQLRSKQKSVFSWFCLSALVMCISSNVNDVLRSPKLYSVKVWIEETADTEIESSDFLPLFPFPLQPHPHKIPQFSPIYSPSTALYSNPRHPQFNTLPPLPPLPHRNPSHPCLPHRYNIIAKHFPLN